MDSQHHWDDVYSRKDDDQLSWFEPNPELSFAQISAACSDPAT